MPFYGESSTYHAYFKTKAENAYRHGAVGIIVVNNLGRAERENDFRILPGFSVAGDPDSISPQLRANVGEGFLAVLSGCSLIAVIADDWPIDVAEVETMVEGGTTPAQLDFPAAAIHLTVAATPVIEPVPVRNVVGFLPGRNRDNYVVIGAHHDHIGSFEGVGDTIFNGADDNASGVAVLLEVARVLADVDLERSIVFVAFTSEEHGFYGSSMTLSGGLLVPQDLSAMVNLDMVGRNSSRPLVIYQSDPLPSGMQTIEHTANVVGISVYMETGKPAGSDFIPFEQSGVPVLSFFSGFHDDYHGVDDEADRLEYDRLTDVAELAARVILGYAYAE